MKAIEKKGVKIKKLVLLSGFAGPDHVNGEREPFFQTFDWQFDFAKIKSLVDEIVIIHDKNDTDVPLRAAEHLGKTFGVKPLIIDAKGEHITAQVEPAILPHILIQ